MPQLYPYIQSWVDNRGNTLTFTFGTIPAANDYGRINKIQSSSGNWVIFSYNGAGVITEAAASDGRTVHYTYNIPGDLVAVRLPDGNEFLYEYGFDDHLVPTHFLTKETKPDGGILQNVYDPKGRVSVQRATVDQTNPNIVLTTAMFNYSQYGGSTTVSDAYGNRTIYKYTSAGLITQIADPLGHSIIQNWYSTTGSGGYAGSLQSVTDKRGLVTTYQYDAQGNITQTQVTGDLKGDPDTPSETATTSATYNSLNLPATVTDASGITTTFTYDTTYHYLPAQIVTSKNGTTLRTDVLTYTAQTYGSAFSKGLLASKTVASGTADQAVTSYTYNAAGLVTQQTAHTGTIDPDVVTTFDYNARGELTTTTDADGRSTTYTYDAMSRPLTKVVKDEHGSVLGIWTTTYTVTGELSWITGPRSAPAANSVQRTYDAAGRLEDEIVTLSQAQTSNPAGVVQSNTFAITSYGYDLFGNLVLKVDPMGNVTTMTYDAIGQLLVKDTAGLRTEYYEYEPGGKVSGYTDPLGGLTNTRHTSTGQPCRQRNPDGSLIQWRYYTDGRLQQEILRNGSSWTTVYDDVNRTATRTLTNAAHAVIATETSVYDRRGNLISHTDPEGYVKTAAYDGLNRLKTSTGPAATAGSARQTTTTIYGASAKTVRTQNGLGETVVTTSDALGRPVQVQVLGTGGVAVRTTSYAYSIDNNAVTVTEGTGPGAVSRTTWTDTLDRPVLTMLGDNTFTSNAYDLNGNLSYATDALGQTTSYAYNALNQLTTQSLPDGTVTGFTYDPAGNLLTRAMANGTLTQAQTYDTAGRKLTEQLYSGSATTRQYSYAYFPEGTPAVGLLQTVTTPRETVTTTYDDFLRPQTLTTAGVLAETNGTTTYAYDRRNLVTSISQSSVGNVAGPATQVSRTYDGYGQMLTEAVTAGGSTYASVTQTWDAAGRRASLNDASSNLPAPLFAYQHRADGLLSQVTANHQNYAFSFADNGLLTARVSPFRSMSVDMRDPAGRILGQTQAVGGTAALVEDMFWRANNTLSSYSANRTGGSAWNETRVYSYDARGQLLIEGFAPAAGATNTLNYTFDGTNPGLGVRLGAKIGTGAPASWETTATADSLGRVTTDNQPNASGRAVPASGVASGADHVEISVDGVSHGRATFPGNSGTWSISLDLAAGPHTLTANAVDPSGLYTAAANSSFTVTAANPSEKTGTVTSAYDPDGNVVSRSWISGLTQTLTWDAFGRLIKVSQRDTANNGSDWTAIYDGLGRRILTAQQPVANNVAGSSFNVATSIYDPQVEFLEIGVAVNGAKAWKVFGPDLNGRFGGLQGTGGLEAVILDATGTTTGVINDQFGNGVATVSGGTVTWNTTRVGAYGPLPGVQAQTLTDVSQLAAATAWRSRRIDPTGFYWLGARNYEPTSGRFLSADPMGHAASPSLYDFCNGDPVNSFDPTGRCKSDSLGKLQDSIDNFGASQTDIFAGLNAVNRFNAQNSGSNDGTNTSLIGTIWNGVSDFFSPGVNELLRPIGSFSESYGSFRDGLEKANTDFNCPVPPGFLGAGLDTLAMAFGDALFATKAAPVIAAETAAVKPGSFSVIDWTGYPEYLPKPTGSVNLVEGAEYTAARRAADVTNNGLREGFGLRGVEVDIHEIQPVKFGGSPTDPLNKMLLPRDLHRQVVTPFWNQLQQDVSPFIYRPPGT